MRQTAGGTRDQRPEAIYQLRITRCGLLNGMNLNNLCEIPAQTGPLRDPVVAVLVTGSNSEPLRYAGTVMPFMVSGDAFDTVEGNVEQEGFISHSRHGQSVP